MSKKNEKQYKKNRNKARMHKANKPDVFHIAVISAPASEINSSIDHTTMEMYPDYSCRVARGAINDNWTCYYIDLQYTNPYFLNDWMLKHAFARRFVDMGMRVFLEDDGLMVACCLAESAFDAKFEGIIQPVLDEVNRDEKAVV